MSANYVRFTVKVLPPTSDPARNESEEQAQPLAIGVKTSETFEELREKLSKRYNARHNAHGERDVQVGELRDKSGADIFGEDIVGSLYDATPPGPGEPHFLFARLVEGGWADKAAGTVGAAVVEAQSAKRHASDEDAGEGAESAKRRKVELSRGGRGESDATGQQVDGDGFKIPTKKDRPSAAIVVRDSQPEETAGAGSAFSRLQQRKGLQSSSPPAHSSPIAQANSRNNADGQVSSKPGSTRKVFPTPDSREWQRPDAETPGEPPSNGQKVSSWFKRRTPTTGRSGPETSATQNDPIEDDEHDAGAPEPIARVPSSSQPERADPAAEDTPGQNHKTHPLEKAKAGDKHRTPSAQRSQSGRTTSSNQQSGSHSGRNKLRSTANGWTKQEDELLLTGMSSRKHITAAEVVKTHGIKRTASAARSRHRLLIRNLGDGKNGTINFPSSSLATELSDDDSSEDKQGSGKRTFKYWTQQDIGVLRKAMGEGLDAREIQAKHFDGRTEEAIMAKMREVQQSVYNLQKRRDSFPKEIISNQLWTDHHSLKLKRAYREGLNVVAAASRYFKTMPTQLVEQNMVAYRRQMEDLAIAKSQREQSSPALVLAEQPIANIDEAEDSERDGTQEEGHPTEEAAADVQGKGHPNEEAAADNENVAQNQDDIDAEILRDLEEIDCSDSAVDGPVVQDSYEVESAAAIPSSPSLMRKPDARYSPEVVISAAEQVGTQQARRTMSADQQAKLRRGVSSGGQMQLNFQRDKGKGAVRPAVDIGELDRQYNLRPEGTKKVYREVIDVSSDEEASSEYGSEESDVESSQPLPQLDGTSSSTVKDSKRRQPSHQPSSEDSDSDGNRTVSSGEPSRQLNLELEQSMSAAEMSTQSQTAQEPRPASSSSAEALKDRPIAYVHIPSPTRGTGTSRVQQAQWNEAEDEEPAFQMQDPGTTLSQKQKKTSPRKTSPRNDGRSQKDQKRKSPTESSDESQGFQTQDPTTTLSQKLKQQDGTEPARKATSMLRDAVDRYDASQKQAEQSVQPASHAAEPLFTKPKSGSSASVKPRRNVYDVPVSSQSTTGTQSQRSSEPLPKSSSEKRQPGQLPRIIGSASRLAQRKKDAEAKAAARKAERLARESSQSQSVTPMQREEQEVVEEIPRHGFPIVDQSEIRPAPLSTSPDAEKTVLHSAKPPQPKGAFFSAITEDHSFDATSVSQVQAEPVVELPYPQILSREPGPNGKLEVGRPGFSWKVPRDCQYLRSDEQILALATREETGERNIKRRAQDIKLSDQQQIAMCCVDQAKLKELHKLERRYRRERRVEDGMPPSRGPARVHWVPGMPKPIEWDVNVMPDSDDSMSSRGRDMDEIDEEMAEDEEERAEMLDDEDNEAFFDRGREIVEVDGSEEDEPERLGEVQEELDEHAVESGSDEEESDEESANDLVDVEAEESDVDKDADSADDASGDEGNDGLGGDMLDAESDPECPARVGVTEAVQEDHDDVEITATAPSTAMPIGDGLPSGIVGDEAEDEDYDDELPTAPPPPSDDAMDVSAPAPSDRELQDLVQSGKADAQSPQNAPAFAATRSPPGLGSSPIGYPILPSHGEGALQHDFSLATTTSFKPVNDIADENTAEYYRRRNASPTRNPELTDSMIPPWPSSGKVRASLERSPTNTPLRSAKESTNMTSKKRSAEADAAEGGSKKRKLEGPAQEQTGLLAAQKAKKKERKEAKRARRLLEKQQAASDAQQVDHQPAPAISADYNAVAKDGTSQSVPHQPKKSKKHRRDAETKHEENLNHQPSKTDDRMKSQQVKQDDRLAMPPPSLPKQHVFMQQSSLPSPDSELSTAGARRALKRAEKRQMRKNARTSSMSASVNGSMTSDTSISMPLASSPPVVMRAQPAEPSPALSKQMSREQVRDAVDETPADAEIKQHKTKKSKKDRKREKWDEARKPAKDVSETSALKPTSKGTNSASAQAPSIQPEDAMHKTAPAKKKKSKTSLAPPANGQPFTSAPEGSAQSTNTEKIKPKKSRKEKSTDKDNATSTTQPHATHVDDEPTVSAKTPKQRQDRGTQPAAAASGARGLKALVDFPAHIPAAPKMAATRKGGNGAAGVSGRKKVALFDDDGGDSDEESSEGSESE